MKPARKTQYWGIKLNKEDILEKIKDELIKRPDLIPLKQVHSTILFVGKVDDERELEIEKYRKQPCKLTITSYGVSDDALALKVDKLEFTNDELKEIPVPTFNNIQHVTVALTKTTKAVDSIKCFDVEVVNYHEPLILYGCVWKYYY